VISVALTEKHGMALEMSKFPPKGVKYTFIPPGEFGHKFFKSPIKGFFSQYETEDHDLIEAILSPIRTKNRWIYSLANFHEAVAFNFMGIPLPRLFRVYFMKRLFKKDNFKKLIFWSFAGKETLKEYPLISNDILEKVEVVYPGIREIPDHLLSLNNKKKGRIFLLFSGDFFRKGGANVIDAFECIQKKFSNARLILCCDKKIDFNTRNVSLKKKYLDKINSNNAIIFLGRIPRDKFLKEILPQTDIYILPTYYEAFGFAVLEAMAYGIPVVSTNLAAIPEMIEDGVSGFLIDIKGFDVEKMFKGYVVNDIPEDFNRYVTQELLILLDCLLSSEELRQTLGRNSLKTTREKFSFISRNAKMLKIYQEALD